MNDAASLFAPIDLRLGEVLARDLPADVAAAVRWAAAIASHERGLGHACADLAAWAGREIEGRRLPPLAHWRRLLLLAPTVGDGIAGDDAALVLDGPALYLARYHRAERRLEANLRQLLEKSVERQDDRSGADLDLLFGSDGDPHQRAAAHTALRSRLALITGGPGTGKTTVVARVLALLLMQHQRQGGDHRLRIRLAAPTGKAAARLAESRAHPQPPLAVPDSILTAMPTAATTVHRLLDYHPATDRFRRRHGNPIEADVVVVDEVSMADLLLMDALVAALPAHARLILVGDAGQLASVETGWVLGDLVRAAEADPASPLAGAVVELTRNFRSADAPGVVAAATAVRRGDRAGALAALDGRHADARCLALPPRQLELASFDPITAAAVRAVPEATSASEALQRLGQVRLLTPLREGPWGVGSLNRWAESVLPAVWIPAAEDDPWYRGRPVLITANDAQTGLFNGDLGICWDSGAVGDDGGLVHFPDREGTTRALPLASLPRHQTAWAMTVHKSQGSEFRHVLLVLPNLPEGLGVRELIYTAITRARSSLLIAAAPGALESAIATSAARRGRVWRGGHMA